MIFIENSLKKKEFLFKGKGERTEEKYVNILNFVIKTIHSVSCVFKYVILSRSKIQ